MLATLAVLVVAVLIIPGPEAANAADMLDYRKSILSVIVTAFGARVGAGPAYYFGHENLREATRNMLAMHAPTPEERLRQTPAIIKDENDKPMYFITSGDVRRVLLRSDKE